MFLLTSKTTNLMWKLKKVDSSLEKELYIERKMIEGVDVHEYKDM